VKGLPLRYAIGIFAATLLAFLIGVSAATAATKLSEAVQDKIIKGCIGNTALVWANPAAKDQLCACYVRNVVKAPDLMDAQRLSVLGFIGGRAATSVATAPLPPERQEAAFQYFLSGRMEKGCVAK